MELTEDELEDVLNGAGNGSTIKQEILLIFRSKYGEEYTEKELQEEAEYVMQNLCSECNICPF